MKTKVINVQWRVMRDFPHAISTRRGVPVGEAYGRLVSQDVVRHIMKIHNADLARRRQKSRKGAK